MVVQTMEMVESTGEIVVDGRDSCWSLIVGAADGRRCC